MPAVVVDVTVTRFVMDVEQPPPPPPPPPPLAPVVLLLRTKALPIRSGGRLFHKDIGDVAASVTVLVLAAALFAIILLSDNCNEALITEFSDALSFTVDGLALPILAFDVNDLRSCIKRNCSARREAVRLLRLRKRAFRHKCES
uniref:Uncharacterized protein n=1 Tax=Glossina austeni TaxID=7395 RepID=A0A1A9V4T9_GLOAU